ncbi:MAG: glycoside hydrolase family 2 [Clostridia bacterium]|nr:glycoside hydrolase family 2 [Clostridia bacterium]
MTKKNDSYYMLTGAWQFCYSLKEYDFKELKDIKESTLDVYLATVPGNFEIDLMSNHIISDVYFGANIEKTYEYENYHKWYFRSFEYKGNKNKLSLIFEGLDCIADVYLNGFRILETDNMLIAHEVSVEQLIKEVNELVVHFKPVRDQAKKHDYPLYSAAFPFNYESLYIRKAPHMYGWDILPRIVSAGIFKDVYLVNKTSVFEEIHIDTMEIEDDMAKMLLYFKLNICDFNMNDYELWLNAKCDGSEIDEKISVLFISGRMLFSINQPELWWPAGKGKPSLYEAVISLYKNNQLVEKTEVTFGVRIVRLIRSETTDNKGHGQFLFQVNGERTFILGTNWVPADALHSRDKERIPVMLDMVRDIGCNMVRCWGGNVYEDDIFYDLCDKEGIMVWQDFSFGCAVYPQDDRFIEAIEKEATSVIKRLRTHACLVLWAGDNEVDCAHSWFGRKTNPNFNVINREILARLVRLHDTYKEYLPSSPFISEEGFLAGDEFLPEYHLWGPRDYYKSDFYQNANCHFASEMGYHGCPSVKSIRKFISEENLWPYENREWQLHATAPMPDKDDRYNFRIQLMANQIKVLFGVVPDNLEDFSYASQVSQAEAMKFFIEHFRSRKWRKTGIIWWNLIDGWPQFSDAVVDYYFDKKLAYSFIKNSQKQILVMIGEENNHKHDILICNDSKINEKVTIRIEDENMNMVFDQTCYSLNDEVIKVGEIDSAENEKHLYKINYEINHVQHVNHYLAGKPHFELNWYKENIIK